MSIDQKNASTQPEDLHVPNTSTTPGGKVALFFFFSSFVGLMVALIAVEFIRRL